MKRTTYILIAALLAGALAICSVIFYLSLYTADWEDTFMKIGGSRQTVALPPCRVVKLVSAPVQWKPRNRKGVIEAERMISFRKVPLEVLPADSASGSLSLAGDMLSFLTVASAGDTAVVTFDFPTEKLEERFREKNWVKIESERMQMAIPADVHTVLLSVEGMETDFRGFRRDTLSFRSSELVRMHDCRIAFLYPRSQSLTLNSGEVEDLYLDLDVTHNWGVKVDSFRIGTEHLTGSGHYHNHLQKGECRRVLWTPKDDTASLDVALNETARIELE